ncbi:MAG: hypothetical protein L6R42_002756 [Xanthoria sp. 1 TBL-2021]|nr:MAG: hypothetical protein L6R42_002756 [Xanthoria sp. 1 TBL-2021]
MIQKKYLAQIYNIAPEYPKAVYELLPKKQFEFSEVEELSKTAHEFYKEAKFRPGEQDRLVGQGSNAMPRSQRINLIVVSLHIVGQQRTLRHDTLVRNRRCSSLDCPRSTRTDFIHIIF